MITINNDKNIVKLEFGVADISVGGGICGGIPSLIFHNIEKTEIGKELGTKSGILKDLDTPVILQFNDERSIDVIIQALEKVRYILNNKKL